MKKRLVIFTRRSVLGAIPVALGGAWKGIEFVHTADYVRAFMVSFSHSNMLANIMKNRISPYIVIIAGCVLVVYFELKYRNSVRLKSKPEMLKRVNHSTSNTPQLPAFEPSLEAVVAEAKAVMRNANELIVRQTTTEIVIRALPDDSSPDDSVTAKVLSG